MIVAFDTFRYESFAYTVGAVFESWTSPKAKYYVTSKRQYKEGDCEMDYILNCLKMLDEYHISHVIVDGFVWVSKDGKELNKGFGKLLQEELEKIWISNPTIIGISEKPYPREIPHCVELKRGLNNESIWITSSEHYLTDYDAKLVSKMYGDEGVPSIIQDVKRKTMEFLETNLSLEFANIMKNV